MQKININVETDINSDIFVICTMLETYNKNISSIISDSKVSDILKTTMMEIYGGLFSMFVP